MMEKMGIRVEWLDRVIREIGATKDHFELLRETRLLRIQFKELQKQMDKAGRRVAELDTEMSHKNFLLIRSSH